MKFNEKRSINIPFEGFYNTKYEAVIDDWTESSAEHEAQSDANMDRPEELRLTVDDYTDILNNVIDFHAAMVNIAKSYADMFSRKASELIGVKLNLEFEAMTSPREYNFETDRIFCDMPYAAVRAMFALSKRDGHKALKAMIVERCTEYDGYSPHYRNDLESWLAKPLSEWDHNELNMLLMAVMDTVPDYDPTDFYMDVYYAVTDDTCFGEIDAATDWEKFNSQVEAIQRDREAEFMVEFPDYVPTPTPSRCKLTPDLFTGKKG